MLVQTTCPLTQLIRTQRPHPIAHDLPTPLLLLLHSLNNSLSSSGLEQVHLVVELHDGVALLALVVVVVVPILLAALVVAALVLH